MRRWPIIPNLHGHLPMAFFQTTDRTFDKYLRSYSTYNQRDRDSCTFASFDVASRLSQTRATNGINA